MNIVVDTTSSLPNIYSIFLPSRIVILFGLLDLVKKKKTKTNSDFPDFLAMTDHAGSFPFHTKGNTQAE